MTSKPPAAIDIMPMKIVLTIVTSMTSPNTRNPTRIINNSKENADPKRAASTSRRRSNVHCRHRWSCYPPQIGANEIEGGVEGAFSADPPFKVRVRPGIRGLTSPLPAADATPFLRRTQTQRRPRGWRRRWRLR